MKKTASSARYEMVQPGLMRRVRVFLPLAVLFLFAVVPVHALYIPCDPGTGLVDPNKVEPDVRECQPCQVKGCAMCTWDSSRCTLCPAYNGPAGSITDDGSSKCKRCTSTKCGVCDNGYRRGCTGKIKSCPTRIRETMSAKETSVKAIMEAESPRCWENTQYWAGNGYSSLKVFQVDKKGRCLECQSEAWWRPLADGGVNYCWYYQRSLKVLANAFEKTSCSFPSSIKAKLKNQCLGDNRGLAFTIVQRFSAEYCGQKKTVYVTSEGSTFATGKNPYEHFSEDDTLTWSWASS